MSIIASTLATAIQVRRTFDGSSFDYDAQKWVPPTPESLIASDKALIDSLTTMLDLTTFPLQANLDGVIQLTITREAAAGVIVKLADVIKEYVNATTLNK